MNDLAKKTQELVLSSLCRPTTAPPQSWLAETLELAQVVKGDEQWSRLQAFSSRVNLGHSELVDTMPNNFWANIRDIVDDGAVGQESRWPWHELRWPKDKAHLLDELQGGIRARLIRDTDAREQFRRAKSGFQTVNMRYVYVLGENAFHGEPEDFRSLVRYEGPEAGVVGHWEEQKRDFSELGLHELANVITRKITLIREAEKDRWLGFHRLRPSQAAVILARMHSMLWHDMLYVVAPVKMFGNTYWVDYEQIENIPEVDVLKRTVVLKEKRFANFDHFSFAYQPRLYPLHAFNDLPEGVREVIAKVETLTEVGGAGFDYYWVLVPGINPKHPTIYHGDGAFRLRIDGQVKEFKVEAEAALALDMALVKDKLLQPCVLGERDGKCFFVSLFC